jgi:ribonuclease HI
MKFEIYTDGAHSSKTNIGGWATIITNNNNLIDQISNWVPNTTNNRMELHALFQALIFVAVKHDIIDKVTIYCDSAYIVNCFKQRWYDKWRKNGWKTSNKTPVLNRDMWEEILQIYEDHESLISIEKISGHSGEKWNEYADELAVAARIRGAKESNINE